MFGGKIDNLRVLHRGRQGEDYGAGTATGFHASVISANYLGRVVQRENDWRMVEGRRGKASLK